MKNFVKTRLWFLLPLALIPEYLTDYWRYVRHSGMMGRRKEKRQLVGRIIQDYHVIEKGLTMPDSRKGFGLIRLRELVDNCIAYIARFGLDDEQVRHAVAVILEYRKEHVEVFDSLDDDLRKCVDRLLGMVEEVSPSTQISTGAEDYFKDQAASFDQFSGGRRSVRSYSSRDIPMETIRASVDLARSAPSSCNKQGSRAHVYTNPEQIEKILAIQTGNRGFGHLVNKLLVVTGDLSFAHNVYERHQVYVDGGMFGMNLLYGLHFHKLVACPLNCYLPYSKERRLREVCQLDDSEMLVMMISCGHAPEEFKVAYSYRYSLDKIFTVHD